METLKEFKKGDVICFSYTNYKGVKGERKAVIKKTLWGTSPYHIGEQAFIRCLDLDRMSYRDFAVCDIESLIVVESIADWDFED